MTALAPFRYAGRMLNYARMRVMKALKRHQEVVLATDGPAGLLASIFPCEAMELALYILVPKTSDHLFNLEQGSTVALVTTHWEIKGVASVVSPEGCSLKLKSINRPVMEWCALVRVDPDQIQFHNKDSWGNVETIDINGTGRSGKTSSQNYEPESGPSRSLDGVVVNPGDSYPA